MGQECCKQYKDFAEEELRFRLNSPNSLGSMQNVRSPLQPNITHLQTLGNGPDDEELNAQQPAFKALVRLQATARGWL